MLGGGGLGGGGRGEASVCARIAYPVHTTELTVVAGDQVIIEYAVENLIEFTTVKCAVKTR